MSEKIRVGNDIDITWSLIDEEEQPYVVEGRDVSVEVVIADKKRYRVKDLDLDGNRIHFVYWGKDQKYTGICQLKFIENDGEKEMVTFDIPDAFTLVAHSWQTASAPENERVQISFVTVTSNLMSKVGPAAGFGEITASVDENSGTPYVDVETSGPNSAKNISFSFHNLRGESIYDFAVKYGHFVGTEEEFEAEYQAALQAARDAATAANATNEEVIAAEALRVVAERNRELNESARSDAEATRVSSEQSRENNETARGNAESVRVSAESGRVTAENGRVSAESARVTAESERASAETSRRSEFESLESDMQTAIGQADAATAAAVALNEEVAGDEADRVAAETARETAESGRVSAESARATAENGRVTAESGRVSAESARVSAETARVAQASSDHTRAESDHGTAATDHTTAGADHTQAGADHTASEAATAAANTAAAAADAARESIQDDLAALGQKVDGLNHYVIGANGISWEMGNISISNSGWAYSNSTSRVRTTNGTTVRCTAGQTAGFGSWAGKRFYVGWRKADGTYGNSGGWKTADYVLPEDGDYVFLLSYSPEATVDNAADLYGDFFLSNLKDRIEILDAKADISDRVNDYVNSAFGISRSRFIPKADGGIYRIGMSVKNGDNVHILFSYVSGHVYFYGINGGVATQIGDFTSQGYRNITFTSNYDDIGVKFRKGDANQFYYIGIPTKTQGYVDVFNLVSQNLPFDKTIISTTGFNIGKLHARMTIDTSVTTYFYSNAIFVKQGQIIHVMSNGNAYTPIAECLQDGTLLRPIISLEDTTNATRDFYHIAEKDMYVVVSGLINNYSADIRDIKRSASFIDAVPRGYTKGINHRGYNEIAPENTLPAFKLSKRMGYKFVETDIRFTSDNVAVCLHDGSINRTATNDDGTAIGSTINIADITYAEALTYDFGQWKDISYAGTRIPTFEQFIVLCRNLGLSAYIELKAGTQAQVESLIDTARAYGMLDKLTWIDFGATRLGYVSGKYAKARLGLIFSSALSDADITSASALKNSTNEVFIDSQSKTNADVEKCKSANMPMEVWTVSSKDGILALDPYISGVTSNKEDASQVLCEYDMYN